MYTDQLKELGISDQVLSKIEIDPVIAFTQDEYEKNETESNVKDFRTTGEKVLKRLIDNKISFPVHHSLIFPVMKNYVKVVCAYCEKEMQYCEAGRNQLGDCVTYRCECGSELDMAIPEKSMWLSPPSWRKNQE